MKLLLLLLSLYSCNRDSISRSFIFSKVFQNETRLNPKILLERKINLDEDLEEEFFYILRNGNEEVISIFKKNKSEYDLVFKKNFSLINIGAYSYDDKKNKWTANQNSNSDSNSLFIIKSLVFFTVKGKNYNAFAIEVLSEEPPFELFSIPLIYNDYKLILDGFEIFKESELLKQKNRIPFELDSKESILKIKSDNPKWNQEIQLN